MEIRGKDGKVWCKDTHDYDLLEKFAKDVIEKLEIRVNYLEVEKRSDTIDRDNSDGMWHYFVQLRREGYKNNKRKLFTIEFYYSKGTGLDYKVTAQEALEVLLYELNYVHDCTRDDFCDMFGYDFDNRRVEGVRAYNKLKMQAKNLYEFLGFGKEMFSVEYERCYEESLRMEAINKFYGF